jgi:hypothetical protein
MAFEKIKVANPIVEMDGKIYVSLLIWRSNQFYLVFLFLTSESLDFDWLLVT